MAEANRLSEFVETVAEITSEETTWEAYLHTIYMQNKPWDEFKQTAKEPEPETATQEELESIINETRTTLRNFNPNGGE